MKRLLLLLFVLLSFTSLLYAQYVFEPYEMHPDSNAAYFTNYVSVSDSSRIINTLETSTVHTGTSAMMYDWRVERAESWGGFAKYEMWAADSAALWNFTAFNNMSIWYNTVTASTDSGHVHLRIEFYDVSDAPINTYDSNNTEFWYSFEYVLDDAPGWHQILLPLEDVGTAATQGSNGFWRTGWAGIAGNNHLDLNMIKGMGFEVSIDAPQIPGVYHSGQIIFDQLTFEGARELPLVFFNGRVVPGWINNYYGWSGQLAIEDNAGHTPDTPALKWVQDPGQAWTGFVYEFNPQYLSLRWPMDSLKFWIKAPSGVGTLRAQFDDINGNAVKKLIDEPTGGYNNTWTQIAIPLSDINVFESGTTFDTTQVTKFEFMAEGTGNGSTIYFDDFWTGNPVIDIFPPDPPASITVVPDVYTNLVTWLDCPDPTEVGETYKSYYSRNPITDVSAPDVEIVEMSSGQPENTGSWSHLLFSPIGDSTVNYYYAETAIDAAGNESEPASTPAPITSTAKGIGTMSLAVPSGFAADGDLSEWSGIKPMRMFPSEGAHIVTNTTVSGDGDLNAQVYMAADADYFYFAFDIGDDVVDTTAANSYEKDSPDIFIGLYNQHGAQHTSYGVSSNEPDYQMRFLPTGLIQGKRGDPVIVAPGPDYYWGENFPVGYVIEGKVAWADIAATSGDAVFTPVNGYRIPIDFSINDADGGGVREGIMAWSPYNDDTSWQAPFYWLYTWVGDRFSPISGIEEPVAGVPLTFDLEQNYPNPFNPTTTIKYQLAKQSKVVLDIFNTLGQKVRTIVNAQQPAGKYQVQVSAQNMASGIYFYRLQASDFVKVNKMILMK